MIKIQRQLTKTEQKTLKGHYRCSQTALIRERAHAVLLSADGHSVPAIAKILFRDADTVYGWIAAFNNLRLASIFPGYRDNQNAAKLTKEQKEEVKQTLANPHGLPASFWTLPKFKQYIAGRFNLVYESNRSYHYLLEYCGYSFKLPCPFDKRRDTEGAQARLDDIHKEIKGYLQSPNWVVLSADEVIVSWLTEIHRAWLKSGEKTVLKINQEKINQSYFGALNLKNGKAHLVRLKWQNQEEILKALASLLLDYSNKRICLLWDNARWHKGKDIRQALSKGQALERLHLINFPPYSPDLNPQELVWKFGKGLIANFAPDRFKELLRKFEQGLRSKTFNYRIPKFVLR